MVLKIKEREEAIQLLAMDPQVCGELLTHHRMGNKVDVEALHDRFRLRQDAGKGLQMGSQKNRSLRWRKSYFVWLSAILGIFENLQRWNQVKRSHEGPIRHQGAPLGRALLPCHLLVSLLASSRSFQGLFCPEKIVKKFHSVWTPFGTDFLENQKQAKNSNWHQALDEYVSPRKSYKLLPKVCKSCKILA